MHALTGQRAVEPANQPSHTCVYAHARMHVGTHVGPPSPTGQRGVVGELGELVRHQARQHLRQDAGLGGGGDGLFVGWHMWVVVGMGELMGVGACVLWWLGWVNGWMDG